MPVSGLVVSLSPDQQQREEALAAIRRQPQIQVGAVSERQAAVVLDTPSSEEDKRLWEWLHSLPGVVFVDVALVGFE